MRVRETAFRSRGQREMSVRRFSDPHYPMLFLFNAFFVAPVFLSARYTTLGRALIVTFVWLFLVTVLTHVLKIEAGPSEED